MYIHELSKHDCLWGTLYIFCVKFVGFSLVPVIPHPQTMQVVCIVIHKYKPCTYFSVINYWEPFLRITNLLCILCETIINLKKLHLKRILLRHESFLSNKFCFPSIHYQIHRIRRTLSKEMLSMHIFILFKYQIKRLWILKYFL